MGDYELYSKIPPIANEQYPRWGIMSSIVKFPPLQMNTNSFWHIFVGV